MGAFRDARPIGVRRRVLLHGRRPGEYPAIYERFVDLMDERRSLVDVDPLRLAADSFLAGSRTAVEPFEE